MRHALLVGAASLLLCSCGSGKGRVLGRAPSGSASHILAVRAGDTPSEVTLHGVMIEKCPAAGCWFYLQDDTGVMKVDTKAAGFVVVDVPLKTEMTVRGKIVNDADEVSIAATGLRME